MPKWRKDATEFRVSVSYHAVRGYQCYLPRPVVEKLEIHPNKRKNPKDIVFELKDGRAEVRVSKEENSSQDT